MTRFTSSSLCLVALVVASAACGLPLFNARPQPLPVLSDRPLDPAEPLARGIVQAVVAQSQASLLFDSLVRAEFTAGEHLFKKAWSDSARAAFTEALTALRSTNPSVPVDSEMVRGLSVTLTHSRGSLQPHPPTLAISPIGYSHDSTYAIVYYRVHCGGRCGHGALLLLARRVGCVWTVWDNAVLWIS